MKRDYILCTTVKNNHYLYSFAKNQILLIHPILKYIIEEYRKGIELEELILGNEERVSNLFSDKYQTSIEDVKYYYFKFKFYMKAGFFKAIEKPDFSYRIKGEEIKLQLANLRQVTFEVTDKCNLNCEYCGYGKYYSDYDLRDNKNMKTEKAKRILDYLISLWNSNFNYSKNQNVYISFYGGEPLLNMPFVKEIVSYAKDKISPDLKIQFSMTTNGVLLQNNIEFLRENLFWLLISLDGNKKNNSYRKFHNGDDSFEHIISQIDQLKAECPEYFNKYVSFNTVLHNRNSMDEIYEFFSEKFNKYPSVSELNNSGISPSLKEEFNVMFRNLNESLYNSENYDDINEEMFINLPDNQTLGIFCNRFTEYFYKDFLDFYLQRNVRNQTPTGTCFPFSKRLFITVNGKILPCERIGQQFGLGFVSNDSIELDFNSIAKKYNNYFDKFRSKCSNCFRSGVCTQCIFNIDTIETEQPYCVGFIGQKEFTKYFQSYLSVLEDRPEVYQRLMSEITIE